MNGPDSADKIDKINNSNVIYNSQGLYFIRTEHTWASASTNYHADLSVIFCYCL